jgi:hypothetical protein
MDAGAANVPSDVDGGVEGASATAPSPITWSDTTKLVLSNYQTTFDLEAPRGATAGDVLVAALALGNSGNSVIAVFSAPSSWSLVRKTDYKTTSSLAVYVHVVTTADPATYRWTSDRGVEGEAWISAYRGVDTARPVDVEDGAADTRQVTTYSTPPLKTTPGALVVAAFAGGKGGSAELWTIGSGPTIRVNVSNGASSGRAGLGVDEPAPASGAVEPLVGTIGTVQDHAIMHVLALRPRQ